MNNHSPNTRKIECACFYLVKAFSSRCRFWFDGRHFALTVNRTTT
jgi:hypothetical protein